VSICYGVSEFTAEGEKVDCQGCGRGFPARPHVERVGHIVTFGCPNCCGTGMATIVERLLATN
jgi:hypothetical protein